MIVVYLKILKIFVHLDALLMCKLGVGYVVVVDGVVVVDYVGCLVYDWMGSPLQLGVIDQGREREKEKVVVEG